MKDVQTNHPASGLAQPADNAWPFPPGSSYRWHVLHVKSHQEKILSEDLSAMNICHYLPLSRQIRYYGKRKVTLDMPVFPSYLFMFGSLDQAYECDRTKRVARILMVADQGQIDQELRNIHLALSRNMALLPYPFISKGVLVEVRSGPLRGLRGIVENRSRPDRLILQVNMLGTATSVEIDGSLLDPVQ